MPYWIIEFRIRFQSDFHVGAGTTLEGGNRHGLRLDENNWPFMPDTQVRGLMRLGAQKLIAWQPHLQPLFKRNFGEPGYHGVSTWSFTSARCPYEEGVTGTVNAHHLGLFGDQSHIRMADGVAENLFAYQKGGVFDQFQSWRGRIYALEPVHDTDAAFMIASMRAEDRIGHRRSRGYGKIVWEPIAVKQYTSDQAAKPETVQRNLAAWLGVLADYTKGARQ